MRLSLISLALLTAVIAVPHASADSVLFQATPYNVFVFGTFNATSDTEGAIAAGGNVTLSNYGVAANLTGLSAAEMIAEYGAQEDTLVSDGTLNLNSGQVYRGNAWEATSTGGSVQSWGMLNRGTINTGGTAPVDFSAAKTALTNLSQSLYAAGNSAAYSGSATCTLLYNNTTTCTATKAGLNIVNVSASMLEVSTINITSNVAGATLVINVSGASDSLGGGGLNVFNNGSTVLFNYYDATSLALTSTKVYGTVLAPNAAVTGGSDNITGQLIAASFSGSTQFDLNQFTGTLLPDTPSTSTPEPATYLLIGAGLLAVAKLRKPVAKSHR